MAKKAARPRSAINAVPWRSANRTAALTTWTTCSGPTATEESAGSRLVSGPPELSPPKPGPATGGAPVVPARTGGGGAVAGPGCGTAVGPADPVAGSGQVGRGDPVGRGWSAARGPCPPPGAGRRGRPRPPGGRARGSPGRRSSELERGAERAARLSRLPAPGRPRAICSSLEIAAQVEDQLDLCRRWS